MTDIDPAIYRKTAEKLSTDGWTKEAYHRPGGSSCLVGALETVTTDRRLVQRGPAVNFLADLIGAPQACGCGCGRELDAERVVTAWNDRPERTKDDVLTLLEQAAEKVEADR